MSAMMSFGSSMPIDKVHCHAALRKKWISVSRRGFSLGFERLEKIGVTAPRNVRVRSQTTLQVVATRFAEERIEWVLGDGASKLDETAWRSHV
jgi:hypothetical protein